MSTNLDRLDDLLRADAARIRPEPSPELERRILAAVRRRRRTLLWLRPAALAAAAGLVLGLTALAIMPSRPPAGPAPLAQAAPALPADLPAIDLGAAVETPLLAEADALRADLHRAAGALAGVLPTLPGL